MINLSCHVNVHRQALCIHGLEVNQYWPRNISLLLGLRALPLVVQYPALAKSAALPPSGSSCLSIAAPGNPTVCGGDIYALLHDAPPQRNTKAIATLPRLGTSEPVLFLIATGQILLKRGLPPPTSSIRSTRSRRSTLPPLRRYCGALRAGFRPSDIKCDPDIGIRTNDLTLSIATRLDPILQQCNLR